MFQEHGTRTFFLRSVFRLINGGEFYIPDAPCRRCARHHFLALSAQDAGFLTLCLVCPLQEEPSDPLWTSEVFTLKGKAHYMELKHF